MLVFGLHVTCFNSTLVQLKELIASPMELKSICFNSTLVQLKVQTSEKSLSSCKRFNSTLVQLKGRIVGTQIKIRFVSILP